MWLAALVAILLLVVDRMGILTLEQAVRLSDGTTVTVPDTYATIDHPFHIARAEALRQALAEGTLPRWISNHQGGYPAEFYPFGVAWLDVIVWAVLGGAFSIASAHKIVIFLIFVAPVLGWLLLARQDRMSPGIAVVALAAHVAIPGVWWSGGYTELVLWGLVTNVAGYVVALLFLGALVRFVGCGSRWWGVASVLLGAFAVACNTRSGIALAAVAVGVLLAASMAGGFGSRNLGLAFARIGLVGLVAMALAAPLLMSLFRFGDLYAFVRYEWYDDLSEYWRSSVDAVTPAVFTAGLIGLILALRPSVGLATRAVALTLVVYVAATIILGGASASGGLVAQLEPTRMMPFQRYLTLYLAAFAVREVVRLLARTGQWTLAREAALATAAVAALFVFVLQPSDSLADDERGLYPIETTAQPRFAETLRAFDGAERLAPEGSAIYVAGSELSWHQQLWAPFETDNPLRYDNWLWLWHRWHSAPGYSPAIGHAYGPNTVLATFEHAYLQDQGIGVVVTLTPETTAMAERSSALELASDGAYDVFVVRQPGSIVTAGAAATVTEQHVESERIVATIEGEGGTAVVRMTWYPRWRATVNGEEVAISRADDGYMLVQVPAGRVRLELTYGTDWPDWLARALSLAALVSLISVMVLRRRFPLEPFIVSGSSPGAML